MSNHRIRSLVKSEEILKIHLVFLLLADEENWGPEEYDALAKALQGFIENFSFLRTLFSTVIGETETEIAV